MAWISSGIEPLDVSEGRAVIGLIWSGPPQPKRNGQRVEVFYALVEWQEW